MCMLLIQCFGRINLARCLAAQSAYIIQPCDALLAALVDHVALFLDVRGFGQVAQPVVPRDALLAVLVDHVALFLDERIFVQVAQPVEPCDAHLAALVDHVALADAMGAFRVCAVGWLVRELQH